MAKVKILSNPYKKQVAYFGWNDRTAEWNPITAVTNPNSKL